MALGTTTASSVRTRVGRFRLRGGAGSRALLAGVAGLSLVALTACGSSTPPPEVPDPVTVTPTIDESRTTPPDPDVPLVWPLTGVPTDEVAQRPAVAVKIENTSTARPQSGLDVADVVWETIVEFEVSRYVAVFHSQIPDEVGPIRSVRPMDPLIVAPLHGLFAYSGGQPGILDLVANSGVQRVSHDAGAAGMYRVSFRSAPHNVYGSISTWIEGADGAHSAPPPQQFAFALHAEQSGAVTAGTPASNLSLRLSGAAHPSWDWDEASGTWLRSEGSTPATAASGARLAAVNVVSITAGHPATGFGAQNGASVPTYELIGSGPVVVATGGRTVNGTWNKPAQDQPMTLALEDGSPLLLAPGNTWVEMIPSGSGSITVG